MLPRRARDACGLSPCADGVGYVWVKGTNANNPMTYAHELGHNVYLHHAAKGTAEQGDNTCRM